MKKRTKARLIFGGLASIVFLLIVSVVALSYHKEISNYIIYNKAKNAHADDNYKLANEYLSKYDGSMTDDDVLALYTKITNELIAEQKIQRENTMKQTIAMVIKLANEKDWTKAYNFLEEQQNNLVVNETLDSLRIIIQNGFENELVKIKYGENIVCKNCGEVVADNTKEKLIKRNETEKYKITKKVGGRCSKCVDNIQLEFERMFAHANSEYSYEGNAIKKKEVVANFKINTYKLMREFGFKFKKYQGTVKKITASYYGSAEIEIESTLTRIPIVYKTLYTEGHQKGSKVYKQISNLSIGAKVNFDFRLVGDYKGDYFWNMNDISLTSEPEFYVRFSNIIQSN